jgi:hypothetical protein
MEVCCKAGQTTDDNIIGRVCFACWINKDTNTHAEYVILFALQHQKSLRKRSSIHVIRTLPIFFSLDFNHLNKTNWKQEQIIARDRVGPEKLSATHLVEEILSFMERSLSLSQRHTLPRVAQHNYSSFHQELKISRPLHKKAKRTKVHKQICNIYLHS